MVGAGDHIDVGLHDTEYGSYDFSVRDPEGNHRSFGIFCGHRSAPA